MMSIYTRGIYIILLLGCGLFWQGCNVVNPHEHTPTYIHVDSFHFVVNPLVRAASSHKINTVWAFYKNNPIGAFDLPATFPVLTDGPDDTGQLLLAPGIAVNGLNNILASYAFYTIDGHTLTAKPGEIINYTPTTQFYTAVKPYIISEFSTGTTGFALSDGNIPMTAVSEDSLVFEGSSSGSILLASPGDSSIDSTVLTFEIPYNTTAFIEFDYKSSLPFYVGLQSHQGGLASTTPYYLAGISPSDHWQKFYVTVADFVATYQGTHYTFYIKTVLPPGQARGRLLIDNIQLITF